MSGWDLEKRRALKRYGSFGQRQYRGYGREFAQRLHVETPPRSVQIGPRNWKRLHDCDFHDASGALEWDAAASPYLQWALRLLGERWRGEPKLTLVQLLASEPETELRGLRLLAGL